LGFGDLFLYTLRLINPPGSYLFILGKICSSLLVPTKTTITPKVLTLLMKLS